jgi:hypothetical protein|nr:MAG TPA: hypothetical protein [Caudoviricetes sp.]
MENNFAISFANNIIDNYRIHGRFLDNVNICPYTNGNGEYDTRYSITLRYEESGDKLISKIRFVLPDKEDMMTYTAVLEVEFNKDRFSNCTIKSILLCHFKLDLPIFIDITSEDAVIRLEDPELLNGEELDKLSNIIINDINMISEMIKEFNYHIRESYECKLTKKREKLRSFIDKYSK